MVSNLPFIKKLLWDKFSAAAVFASFGGLRVCLRGKRSMGLVCLKCNVFLILMLLLFLSFTDSGFVLILFGDGSIQFVFANVVSLRDYWLLTSSEDKLFSYRHI